MELQLWSGKDGAAEPQWKSQVRPHSGIARLDKDPVVSSRKEGSLVHAFPWSME